MDEVTGIDQIRVVLVDDEEHCRNALKRIIDNHIPDISLMAMGKNVSEGVKFIDECRPELVFLDIELPDGNGFDIIDLTSWKDYQVIFITSHNEFALKAFEVSAIQYLLKPVSIVDLKNAVERYKRFKTDNLYPKKLEVMKQNLAGHNNQVVLTLLDGYRVVDLNDIVYFKTVKDYSLLNTLTEKDIIVIRRLAQIEESLAGSTFFRVNNNHLVNLNYVQSYDKGKNPMVKLRTGYSIEISERKKADFIEAMKSIARHI